MRGFGGIALRIEWGSVADWVSGLATAGALFFGFYLLMRERRLERRATADRFATWFDVTKHSGGKAGTSYDVTVSCFNGGPAVVPYAVVKTPLSGQTRFVSRFFADADGDVKPIMPGMSLHETIFVGAQEPDMSDWVVHFVDTSGKSWYRHLHRNKYLTERQWRRIETRPGRHRWKTGKLVPHSYPD